MALSIVIPIYNSASKVSVTVDKLVQFCRRSGYDFEILLRDDHSADGAIDLLRQIPEKYPGVKVFENERNQGLGYTLRQLFDDAKGEAVVYFDCDLPFGADILKELLEGLKDHDMVLASRYRGVANQVIWPRKWMSRLYWLLCRALFSVPVADIGSGTVAFRKSVISQLNLSADGFDIHIEWFAKARKGGFTVQEIPALSCDDGQGSFKIGRH